MFGSLPSRELSGLTVSRWAEPVVLFFRAKCSQMFFGRLHGPEGLPWGSRVGPLPLTYFRPQSRHDVHSSKLTWNKKRSPSKRTVVYVQGSFSDSMLFWQSAHTGSPGETSGGGRLLARTGGKQHEQASVRVKVCIASKCCRPLHMSSYYLPVQEYKYTHQVGIPIQASYLQYQMTLRMVFGPYTTLGFRE